MKKLLGIVVLGLLWCNVSASNEINYKKTILNNKTSFPLKFYSKIKERKYETEENILLILCIEWMYRDAQKIYEMDSDEPLDEETVREREGKGSLIEDLPREESDGWGYRVLHQGYRVWWLVTAVGLCLAILLLIWYAQDPEYAPELVWDPTTRDGIVTWVGLIGTSLSIILYISSKNFFADDTEATIGDKLNSLDETLVHAASETAFVTFWVLIAYLAFEFGMIASGISESDISENGAGAGAVVVAAAVGLIPGCGPQIIAITAYVEGVISFPALVANAISQDGDALFPLLVRHKVASIWATIHTTLPAIIIGLAFLWVMGEYPALTSSLQP
mgnify:CR=1 FL=1